MATNKERIERLEVELGSLQNGMHQMELRINEKLHHLEETLSKLTESITASKRVSSHSTYDQIGSSRPNHEENEGRRQKFLSRLLKLEFPRYSRDDPTEWFN